MLDCEKPSARSVPISRWRLATAAYIVIIAPIIAPTAKKMDTTVPERPDEERRALRLLLVERRLAQSLEAEALVVLHAGAERVELARRVEAHAHARDDRPDAPVRLPQELPVDPDLRLVRGAAGVEDARRPSRGGSS